MSESEREEVRHRDAQRQASHRANREGSQVFYKRALQPVGDSDNLLTEPFKINVCSSCRAFKLKFESPGSCCMHGQVPAFEFHRPDDHIISLYRGNSPVSKLFRKK